MLCPPRDRVRLLQDDIPRAQVRVFDILEAACKNKTSLDGVTAGSVPGRLNTGRAQPCPRYAGKPGKSREGVGA